MVKTRFRRLGAGLLALALLTPQMVRSAAADLTMTSDGDTSVRVRRAALNPLLAPTDRFIVKISDAYLAQLGRSLNVTELTNIGSGMSRLAWLLGYRPCYTNLCMGILGDPLQFSQLREGALNTYIFTSSRALAPDAAKRLADALSQSFNTGPSSSVESIEVDDRVELSATPSDQYYGIQWNLWSSTAGLNIDSAWNRATGRGVVVAVLDSGYRPHVDLVANILPGYDMVGNGNGVRDADARDPGNGSTAGECGAGSPAIDSNWHGTTVAGVIGMVANRIGGVGVAYGAKILPVRVAGKCQVYESDFIDGMVWAAGGKVPGVPLNPNPARVLNMSFGAVSTRADGACPSSQQRAVDFVRSRQVVVVSTAGNKNTDSWNQSPGNCAGVIMVAATDPMGARAAYSNYGPRVTISAPGGSDGALKDQIITTSNMGTKAPGADLYVYGNGTSYAAPHVSGVVALMLEANPFLTSDAVESRLRQSARPFLGACNGCGAGMLDADRAVTQALNFVTVQDPVRNSTRATALEVIGQGTIVNNINLGYVLGDRPPTRRYYKVLVPPGKTLLVSLSDRELFLALDISRLDKNGNVEHLSNNGLLQPDRASATNNSSNWDTFYVSVENLAIATFNNQVDNTPVTVTFGDSSRFPR